MMYPVIFRNHHNLLSGSQKLWLVRALPGSWNPNHSGMTHGPHGSCQGFLVSPLLRKLALGFNDGRSSLCLGPPSSVKSGLPELESIVLFFANGVVFVHFLMGEVGGSFEPSVSFFETLFFLPGVVCACFFLWVVVVVVVVAVAVAAVAVAAVAAAVVPVVFSFHLGCVYHWWFRLDVCIIRLDRICLDWLEVG